mgnify:CR=1 FL=1
MKKRHQAGKKIAAWLMALSLCMTAVPAEQVVYAAGGQNETEVTELTENPETADHKGLAVCSEKTGEREFLVTITAGEGNGEAAEAPVAAEEVTCTPDGRRKGMVVVLSSNQMGQGDEALGKLLMKGFVFALTQQDMLPETILLYNSGAFLSCEGSDNLEDLKTLEAQGVEILTCGTCLNHYGLAEKRQVGGVTNMYEIVEKMTKASVVVRP